MRQKTYKPAATIGGSHGGHCATVGRPPEAVFDIRASDWRSRPATELVNAKLPVRMRPHPDIQICRMNVRASSNREFSEQAAERPLGFRNGSLNIVLPREPPLWDGCRAHADDRLQVEQQSSPDWILAAKPAPYFNVATACQLVRQ